MRNWCEWLAEKIRPLVDPYPVYSYCNPLREYNGETLIEFNENDYSVKTLLSGDEILTHKMVASCRTPTFEYSEIMARNLRALINGILKEETALGLEWFAFDETGVTADARGIVEGESFHGYVEFTVTERVNHEC